MAGNLLRGVPVVVVVSPESVQKGPSRRAVLSVVSPRRASPVWRAPQFMAISTVGSIVSNLRRLKRRIAGFALSDRRQILGNGRSAINVVSNASVVATFALSQDASLSVNFLTLSALLSAGVLYIAALSLARRRRKRKEEETLRCQAEKRLRAIVSSALDCIITIDHRGRLIELNPAAERTFGYRRDQAIGRRLLSELISLREQHSQGLTRYLATTEAINLGKRVELTATRSDGTKFPVEVAIVGTEKPQILRPSFAIYPNRNKRRAT
jgi:PAS domain S-box-containing protein